MDKISSEESLVYDTLKQLLVKLESDNRKIEIPLGRLLVIAKRNPVHFNSFILSKIVEALD